MCFQFPFLNLKAAYFARFGIRLLFAMIVSLNNI